MEGVIFGAELENGRRQSGRILVTLPDLPEVGRVGEEIVLSGARGAVVEIALRAGTDVDQG